MSQIVISPSELDTMRQCALKHQLSYSERWTKDVPTTDARGLGTLWHSVLEAHYRAIQIGQSLANKEHGDWKKIDRDATLERIRATTAPIIGESDPEVSSLLDWLYAGHLEAYGLDDQWQIMAVEHSAEVDLPAPIEIPGAPTFRLKMKIDLVVKAQGRICIVDHKSCKNLPNGVDLDFDDQFGLYTWGMRKLGYKVFCSIYSAARKTRLKTKEAPLSERFKRIPMTRGDVELDRIALEAWQIANDRYTGLQRIREWNANGLTLEAPRSPNPTTCGWRCDFTEACLAGRKGTSLREYLVHKGFHKDHSRH